MLQFDTGILDLEQKPILLDSGCRRSNTVTMRYQAVRRAILAMRERYMEQLSLAEIAEAAQLSPFHFDRVFRSMIGVSPYVFLASIRMKEAKRLLLTTNHSVTGICFDVGYTSLGTFTSRFTLLVGLPPSRFRQFAREEIMQTRLGDLQNVLQCLRWYQPLSSSEGIKGSIHATEPFKGLIFTGLFSSPLPQGRPVGCCIQATSGSYSIPPVPDGEYYLFSAAIDQSQNFFSVLTQGPSMHGGRESSPIVVRDGCASKTRDIVLGPPSWADPPIVVAFPWLFMQHFYQYSSLAM
ncbi:MAG TPA: AraC family transcriptional regulator [Ktedonobacteraceae bacterium]|nr:AraC family transcriptional regulator [Ktedonobacteraceae bacterium]